MTVPELIAQTGRIFLDTPPVIYHIEGNPQYQPFTDPIFQAISNGNLEAATSPITLAECLVHPYRLGDLALAERFQELIVAGRNTRYVGIDAAATSAAELRAGYNLTLTDAFRIAAALAAGCDSFLTNDSDLRRVTELTVVVLNELER